MNYKTVEFGNLLYFVFVVLGFGILFALFFLLRKKSYKTQFYSILGILFFNLVLHFTAAFYVPGAGLERMFMDTLCGVTVVSAPFIYMTKNRFFMTGLTYMGIISGLVVLFVPGEAIGKDVFQNIDVWRFYIQHYIVWITPILMMAFGHFRPHWKDIFIVPLYVFFMLCFVLCNLVFMQHTGFVADMTTFNRAFIWRFNDDAFKVLFEWTVPNFLKTTSPTGYIPVVYLIPGICLYFPILSGIIYGCYKGLRRFFVHEHHSVR